MSIGSDIADEYISDLNFGAAELLRSEIDAAIAAAVQAEREACADMALMSTDTRANLAYWHRQFAVTSR